jgi:hypothetical protein
MKARLVKFGEIEVEGKRYTHDVVIEGGKVRKRKKGASKHFREEFGHTPLSAEEEIPWGGKRLLVGTGGNGRSPSGGETARHRAHCGAHIGSLSVAGGSEEGPGVRHPALHVLTGVGRPIGLKVWPGSRQLFIRTHNETFSVVAMCVSNPDR